MPIDDSTELPPYTLTWMSDTLFELKVDHGSLIASLQPEWNKMLITDFVVSKSFRREGIGKNLLRIAKAQARDLGATAILATIVSRESIDAMVDVFGEQAVIIDKAGAYGQDERPDHLRHGTRAWLQYEMPGQE